MTRNALALALIALSSCAESPADPDRPADGAEDAFLLAEKADGLAADAFEAEAILALVNDADLATLDDEVGLDSRAAENIVAHRDGPDGRPGTSDDDPFDDLAELDAIPYVGPTAFATLLRYVRDHDLVAPPSHDDAACLLISEYVEGSGNYNKAIEVLNCSGAPVELSEYGVCLVRNDDRACTFTAPLGQGLLAPGDVVIGCRSKGGTFNDPHVTLRDRCQTELVGVATWNGDDRVMLVHLATGQPVDMLGRPGYRPPNFPWADVVLRRCAARPVTDPSAFYREEDHFTRHARSDFTDFGKPPAALSGCPR